MKPINTGIGWLIALFVILVAALVLFGVIPGSAPVLAGLILGLALAGFIGYWPAP